MVFCVLSGCTFALKEEDINFLLMHFMSNLPQKSFPPFAAAPQKPLSSVSLTRPHTTNENGYVVKSLVSEIYWHFCVSSKFRFIS